MVQNDNDRMIAACIPKPIRNVCITLHQDTDAAPTGFSISTGDEDAILWSPTSYLLCNIPGRHSDSTFHTHDDSASTTFARIDLHDDAALALASLSSPDAPSSSVPASLHVPKSLTDVPPLGDFHPDHHTITESLRTPVTSQDPAAAGTILVPDPTPETLTSVPPLSSTTPPAAISLQHNAD
ncbi:hypothetical protein EDB92DRAFT_1950861 [Lactarius akahatsu]|uniref:Uncharacterized protein n=1 Tax=Lactarius akahatsu TaxID=416441 RepID=A0AAD4LAW4_9AGAM|nr:hypothetical protein EDB92DRAFT_1950861 [Lactarius akahatsu]